MNAKTLRRWLPLGASSFSENRKVRHGYVAASLSAILLVAASADGPETKSESTNAERVPVKKLDDLPLKQRDFTFVRVRYSTGREAAAKARANRGRWATDWPDADLNFSARFSKVTGLKSDPDGKVMELTDPALKRYPFVYVSEPGAMQLSGEEAAALRAYLLGGGFLMADDFWGEAEWDNLATEMAKVFPEWKPVELPIEHPIFHCYYDLQQKPQVPNVALGIQSQYNDGVTWERADAKEPHYRGIIAPNGRLLAVFCHNTDLGDGWEREGADAYYYREFSLKKAYPLGINIVLYALTH
jgi:hypothetical protein